MNSSSDPWRRSKHEWRRLKVEIRLALAAWLVCKARDLTPDYHQRTQGAFYFLLKAMISEDAGEDRIRVWTTEPVKRGEHE